MLNDSPNPDNSALGTNALETILEDGKVLRDMTLQEVRDIAVKYDTYNETTGLVVLVADLLIGSPRVDTILAADSFLHKQNAIIALGNPRRLYRANPALVIHQSKSSGEFRDPRGLRHSFHLAVFWMRWKS